MGATIAEILLEQGRHAAESRRARAGAWQPFLQSVAQIPGQIMADRRAAADRRLALEDREQDRAYRDMQTQLGQQQLSTREQEQQAQAAAAARQAQFAEIVSDPTIRTPEGLIDTPRALSLATQKGYDDLGPDLDRYAEEHNARVLQRLNAEATRQAQGQQSRQAQNALGVRRMIGEAVTQRAGQPMTPQDVQTLQGMAFQEGVELPKGLIPEPAAPDTRALNIQLADAIRRGDRPAMNAIRQAMREAEALSASSQQERSGYFTMTPVYDAQGRPIGAMKLNARTGETEFVQPDQLGGGVTARPPGNLGQRTVENEAALDSLDRLKKMYDDGAKADIGPLEGRARSLGQKVPGGAMVTERFANFEAATRAFQNAMIKAITGAQMSEPEAQRIMAQIPNVNDNPTVWKAKYDQSVKNMEDLERRTRVDRPSPPNPDATDALLDELLRGGR